MGRFTTYFVEGGYSPDEQSKLVHQFVKVRHHMILTLVSPDYMLVVFNGADYHASIVVVRRKGCH